MKRERVSLLFKKAVLTLLVTFVLIALLCNIFVLCLSSSICASAPDQLPEDVTYDAILVLGAGINADGTPKRMLSDRLNTAIALYREEKAPVIIVSGDKHEGYDEVGAMRTYLQDKGIPEQAIVLDIYGFSTRESIDNLKFSAENTHRFLIVTQSYHLPRALFLATAAQLNATGVSAEHHIYPGQLFRDLREFFARTKDVLLAFS